MSIYAETGRTCRPRPTQKFIFCTFFIFILQILTETFEKFVNNLKCNFGQCHMHATRNLLFSFKLESPVQHDKKKHAK